MKIVFAGTPDIAATVLAELLAKGHEVIGVLTQPDRPSGRGRKLTASPVKQLAQQHNIPVLQPERLKTAEDRNVLEQWQPDLMIVVAYGLILPQAVLDWPRLGCWNVHVSLLPRWRGAAPIQRAIEAGDAETGVTIMQMDAGLDTGDILLQKRCDIAPADSAKQLHDRLAELGAEALCETLALLVNSELKSMPQPEAGVTYAKKLQKAEANIDWQQSADDIVRKIKAFNPWPVAYSGEGDRRLRLWDAVSEASSIDAVPGAILSLSADGMAIAAGKGTVRVLECQLPGKRRMLAEDWCNAAPDWLQVGQRLL